jgi:hypothetical protein
MLIDGQGPDSKSAVVWLPLSTVSTGHFTGPDVTRRTACLLGPDVTRRTDCLLGPDVTRRTDCLLGPDASSKAGHSQLSTVSSAAGHFTVADTSSGAGHLQGYTCTISTGRFQNLSSSSTGRLDVNVNIPAGTDLRMNGDVAPGPNGDVKATVRLGLNADMLDGNLLIVMTVSEDLRYDWSAWTSLHPRPSRGRSCRAISASSLGLMVARRPAMILHQNGLVTRLRPAHAQPGTLMPLHGSLQSDGSAGIGIAPESRWVSFVGVDKSRFKKLWAEELTRLSDVELAR